MIYCPTLFCVLKETRVWDNSFVVLATTNEDNKITSELYSLMLLNLGRNLSCKSKLLNPFLNETN